LKRKLRAILGVKGFLCLLSLAMVVLALVAYTAQVTITPTQQFTIGATTQSWTIYINDVNQIRYLPGSGSPVGSTVPTTQPPTTADSTTFAFYLVTDASKGCSVNITLTSPVNSSKFSKFEIRAMRWVDGVSDWVSTDFYDQPSGGGTKSFIDGLTNDFGYIQQSGVASTYYLLNMTYSYDLPGADTTTAITVTFSYTPLPQ
jgi:hypothetical protein